MEEDFEIEDIVIRVEIFCLNEDVEVIREFNYPLEESDDLQDVVNEIYEEIKDLTCEDCYCVVMTKDLYIS